MTRTYSDEDLLDWIRAFDAEFGRPPRVTEVKQWPGPCQQTYRNRFGRVTTAIREAGLEPMEVRADD